MIVMVIIPKHLNYANFARFFKDLLATSYCDFVLLVADET
jgi:hypothetical protein